MSRTAKLAGVVLALLLLGSVSFFFPDPYGAGDFPCSGMAEVRCGGSLSAQRANRAVLDVNEGRSFRDVLNLLALERVSEWKVERHAASGFTAGLLRKDQDERRLDSRRGPLWRRLHERAIRELKFGIGEGYRPLRYPSSKGEDLFAGEIRAAGFDARVRNCSPERAERIVADVMERLEAIRAGRLGPKKRQESFTLALYGFLLASPFQEGNGEIGREFFAAAHRSLFGSRLKPLPEEIEWLALTSTSFDDFRVAAKR